MSPPKLAACPLADRVTFSTTRSFVSSHSAERYARLVFALRPSWPPHMPDALVWSHRRRRGEEVCLGPVLATTR